MKTELWRSEIVLFIAHATLLRPGPLIMPGGHWRMRHPVVCLENLTRESCSARLGSRRHRTGGALVDMSSLDAARIEVLALRATVARQFSSAGHSVVLSGGDNELSGYSAIAALAELPKPVTCRAYVKHNTISIVHSPLIDSEQVAMQMSYINSLDRTWSESTLFGADPEARVMVIAVDESLIVNVGAFREWYRTYAAIPWMTLSERWPDDDERDTGVFRVIEISMATPIFQIDTGGP